MLKARDEVVIEKGFICEGMKGTILKAIEGDTVYYWVDIETVDACVTHYYPASALKKIN